MKTGEFIQFVSGALGVGEPTVKQVVRGLKDASPSLFSMGLRGRYSPDVTTLDAAHTIIALVGTDRPPARPAETVEAFRGITMDCPSDGPCFSDFGDMDYVPDFVEVINGMLNFKFPSLIGAFSIALMIDERAAEIETLNIVDGQSFWERLTFSQGFETGEEVMAAVQADEENRIIRTIRKIYGSQLMEIAVALRN